MAESLELLFGMTGDAAVASRINALNRSFKGLERTTKGFSRLAGGVASFGALRGGVQSIFSPDNIALLNRHIIRPITLDMRKLARYIKTHPALKRAGSFLSSKVSQIANSDVMKKIKDYMDVNFKKLSSVIGSQLKKLAPALSRLSGFTGGVIGGATGSISAKFATMAFGSQRMYQIFRSLSRSGRPISGLISTAIEDRLETRLFNKFGISHTSIRGKDYYTKGRAKSRFGKIREILNIQAHRASLFGVRQAARLERFAGRGIGVAYSSVVSAVKRIFPYAMVATAVAGFLAATDRRVEAFFKKWAQRGEYYLSKTLSLSMMGWQYMLKSAAYAISGSKYVAFDASKKVAEEIKNRGLSSPAEIKQYIDQMLNWNLKKWEANQKDFKENLILELNKLSEKRLKPIDDLLYTQLRDARL